MNMNDWNSTPWIYQDWVPVAGGIILGVALIVSVIWFIDGMRKYGYWFRKEEENER